MLPTWLYVPAHLYLTIWNYCQLYGYILRSVRIIANCILTIWNTLSTIATLVITKGRSIYMFKMSRNFRKQL